MAYSAHYPYGTHSTDADHYAAEFRAALGVTPTDRIGPPQRRPYGKWLTWCLVLTSTAAASALHVDDPARWPRWWAEASTLAAPLIERVVAAMPAVKAAADALSSPAEPTTTRLPGAATAQPPSTEADAAPSADAQVVAAAEPVETTIAAAPPVAAVEADTPAAKSVAKEDPNRARATAVGLSPDISRLLLARLSDADYRNAGVAIQKALAETPDDNVLYWPLKTKSGVAQFQVHFVPGADEGCRRYVVTIAKDGWATTALPMDNCAVKRISAQAKGG